MYIVDVYLTININFDSSSLPLVTFNDNVHFVYSHAVVQTRHVKGNVETGNFMTSQNKRVLNICRI